MNRFSGLVSIHIAVFLFGAAGLFGELIDLPASLITLGRVAVASISLFIAILVFKGSFSIKGRRDFVGFVLAGILLAFHWTAFFQSIQLSSVAIGLLTFATFPAFTTFLEPLFFKEKLQPLNVLWAVICLLGVSLVIPELDLSSKTTQGAVWGVASGFSFALLSLVNRHYVASYSNLTLTFYQCAVASVCLLPSLFFIDVKPSPMDWGYIIILGSVFTALAHSLFIMGMRTIKAQVASIIASLEPVYGIILAWLILGQSIEQKTLFGAIIILGAAYAVSRKKIN